MDYLTTEVTNDDGKRVSVSLFPSAPLARMRLHPATRNGVVLDVHDLRRLHDGIGEIIDTIEGRP